MTAGTHVNFGQVASLSPVKWTVEVNALQPVPSTWPRKAIEQTSGGNISGLF